MACQREGLGQYLDYFGNHTVGYRAIAHCCEQYRELVTTETRNRVGGPDAGTEASGNFTKQQVSHSMAAAVVDMLEAIEVQVQQSQIFAVSTCQLQGHVQPIVKKDAIGQVGQCVVAGHMTQACL